MTHPSGRRLASNILLVCLIVLTMLFAAFNEGYLSILTWPFSSVLLGAVGMMVWLAWTATPARFLSLVVSIFAIEYIKEGLGIRYGFWIYHGIHGSYIFGVWSWVLGGITCYTLATRALAPLLGKLPYPRSRRWNSALVLVFAILGLVLMGSRTSQAGWLFWIFYLILVSIAILRSSIFAFPLFASLVITSWAVSNLSEYLGSSACGVWTFPNDPTYPPFFLLFACWPIEIVAQTSIAMLLVPPSESEAMLFPT